MIKNFAAENAELLKKAADGDAAARDEIVIKNMGLVKSVVRRFDGRGYETEDLFQIGCVGLIRAAERFDSSFGVQFSTYAVPMIIGEIKRFIRDDGIIKVSRSLKDIAYRAAQIKEKKIKETGQEPSVLQIAEEMGISSAELAVALDSQLKPQSIYMTADEKDGEGRELLEKIESPEDGVEEMLNKMLIKQIMSKLDKRERAIVTLRYFERSTQAQVAEFLGISQVQVSRLEKKILQKMRSLIVEE